jgi:hypothetical protein
MRVTLVGTCAVGGAKADVSTPESLFYVDESVKICLARDCSGISSPSKSLRNVSITL